MLIFWLLGAACKYFEKNELGGQKTTQLPVKKGAKISQQVWVTGPDFVLDMSKKIPRLILRFDNKHFY